ncbi:uncharacterized protein PV09_08781 [Verruconis gallopava]|uniref:Uncharacterized protein n=1 Tax=Verruconis gallopava TaxID=253628 RepID=A0A0D1YFT5_9PEZI|nr:uncharacterized protein PV09_08781 [Verruconis gallopava]KIV99606.1 hypothetical protein PV09_08781 [Verruconis gallopava]
MDVSRDCRFLCCSLISSKPGDALYGHASETAVTCDDGGAEAGMSALQYARSCGFSQDFLLEDPLDIFCATNPLPPLPMAQPASAGDLPEKSDVSTAFGVAINSDETFRERIMCAKEGALFLQKIVVPEDDGAHALQFEDAIEQDRSRLRAVKTELPLLTTDHEMDMTWFCGRSTRLADLRDVHLPMEDVNVQDDEGLAWPLKYRQLPQETFRIIERARLECPRDTLKYIQDLVADPNINEDLENFDIWCQPYVDRATMELVSPPLLPILSPSPAPFNSFLDTDHLQFVSDGSDFLAADIEALDRELFAHDQIVAANSRSSEHLNLQHAEHLAQIYTPLQSDIFSDDGAQLRQNCKRDELMLEPPIILSACSSCSSNTRERADLLVKQIEPVISNSPPSRLMQSISPELDASFEMLRDEFVATVAYEAVQAAENEQLLAADCLQRVEVPTMDFKLPTPPWKVKRLSYCWEKSNMAVLEEYAEIISMLKVDTATEPNLTSWKLDRAIERQLQPFPFLSKSVDVPEERGIDDLRYLSVVMSDMSLEDVVTSDALVWKPDGLRVLRCAEYEYEEDELEAAGLDLSEEAVVDLDSLLRKRQHDFGLASNCHDQVGIEMDCALKSTLFSSKGSTQMTLAAETDVHFFEDNFTTRGRLRNFMMNMGHQSKRRRIGDSQNQALLKSPAGPTDRTDITTAHAPVPAAAQERSEMSEPFSLPPLPSNPAPRSVILSLNIIQMHRRLLRTLFQDLCPNIGYIERDFSLLQDASEADILLSPGAGLVMTTLQKIKQKPLPGQDGQLSGIMDRIARLTCRYEILIVLVSEAITPDTEMDQRDCEAIAEFAAFCSTCQAEVQIFYVPAGYDNLAAWLATSLCEYSSIGQRLQLLQEETLWEQVLRRTGLNAFAAQTVLASLKADSVSSSSGPFYSARRPAGRNNFGLGAFVRMEPEERMVLFERALCGRSVLQRVNQTLEQSWPSARTGFR